VSKKPIIGVTLGDPQGVGPEVVVKAVLSKELANIPIIVFGSYPVLLKAIKKYALKKCLVNFIRKNNKLRVNYNIINLVDIGGGKELKITCKAEAKSGRAAYNYILEAINWANKGIINGVVTAPISKEALKLAKIK